MENLQIINFKLPQCGPTTCIVGVWIVNLRSNVDVNRTLKEEVIFSQKWQILFLNYKTNNTHFSISTLSIHHLKSICDSTWGLHQTGNDDKSQTLSDQFFPWNWMHVKKFHWISSKKTLQNNNVKVINNNVLNPESWILNPAFRNAGCGMANLQIIKFKLWDLDSGWGTLLFITFTKM